jgi:hypothetical protein
MEVLRVLLLTRGTGYLLFILVGLVLDTTFPSHG